MLWHSKFVVGVASRENVFADDKYKEFHNEKSDSDSIRLIYIWMITNTNSQLCYKDLIYNLWTKNQQSPSGFQGSVIHKKSWHFKFNSDSFFFVLGDEFLSRPVSSLLTITSPNSGQRVCVFVCLPSPPQPREASTIFRRNTRILF